MSTYLHFSGQILENIVDLVLETTRQHFIGFIQHEHFYATRLWRFSKTRNEYNVFNK